MKTFLFAMATIALSANAFADSGIHNISRFTIDWKATGDALTQGDGLGCPDVPNIVMFTIPGEIEKDFTIENGNGATQCPLIYSQAATEGDGTTATTLIYKGDCSSDNDENFTIHNKASGKDAHITVDSGC